MSTTKKKTDMKPRNPRHNTTRDKKLRPEDQPPRPRRFAKNTDNVKNSTSAEPWKIDFPSEVVASLGEAVATSLMQNEEFRTMIQQTIPARQADTASVSTELTEETAQDDLAAENEALKKEVQQYQLIKEASLEQFEKAQETIAALQADIEQKEAQLESMQQQLIRKNKIMNDAIRERDERSRGYSAMENSLDGISATVFGAINQPLAELEARLSIASRRKKPQRNDIKAAMTSLSALREALREIDIGGGYSIEIMPLIDEEQWTSGEIVYFNDDIHKNGVPGDEVIVLSRGYRYNDAAGEEKTVKAEVEPQASSLEDGNTEAKENE